MAAKILHKKSNAVTNGVPSLPSPSVLDYGEIAINYKAGKETISIKNDAGEIATFISSSQQAFEKTANDGTVSTLGNCSAASAYSFSVGESTITNNEAEHAIGKYNVSNTGSTDSDVTMHSVGIGNSNYSRKNAFEVMLDGGMYVYGVGNYDGTNANAVTADTLQAYLEKKEFVIAASLNDLNDKCIELDEKFDSIDLSISSIEDSIPDASTLVAKSGDTMDTGATLVLKSYFPDEGDGSTAYTNTISGSGISITDDWGSSVDLSKFGLTIQDSWYGSCVGLDYDGISFGSSPMVVKVLSFPQTGGTIALTSDIPQPVSALTSACTHSQVPSAKAVYDVLTDNELVVATAMNNLNDTIRQHTADTGIHVTSSEKAQWNAKLSGITINGSAATVVDGVATATVSGLPAVTAADNGKILKVVNGAWVLVDPVTVYTGASAPNNSIGEDGDIYLQTE